MDTPITIDPATLGARIQRLRTRQGLSMRDLAERAGVDKNTILRLEKGLPTSARTRDRVCDGLGVYVSRLALPEPDEQEVVSIHRRTSETWWPYPGMGEPTPLPTPLGDAQPSSAAPAADKQALSGDARGFVASLACRMPQGRLRSSLLRLYEETTVNAHGGEELVFCLHGTARLTVAGAAYTLGEGDAATFWPREPHTYAPASGVIAPGEAPVLLLTVWVGD